MYETRQGVLQDDAEAVRWYPNSSDLGGFLSNRGLNSVQECRNWVYAVAASRGDENLTLGDYE